ncbi:AAA family ATPase [Streptomyces sp. NPDC056160]|uniref:AAA family ATPase n=1 Tax=Streptomyces sp. NPDC056160 TaxID=3345731 RepID=UPI0035E2783C
MQRGAGALAGSGDTPSGALPASAREHGPDGERAAERLLVTVAVRDYDDDAGEFADGIDEQLSVLDAWWCPPGAGEPFRKVPQPDLRERHDVERFLHEAGVRETRAKALVLFVTGHGKLGASGTHFLQLPATQPRRQLATAVRTSEIVAAALDSHAEHVLVIVNTCYARGVADELVRLYREIGPKRRHGGTLEVIATCDHDQLVHVRRFPSVLRRVLDRLRTTAQITSPWLSVAHLMTEFENELGSDAERRKHRLHRVVEGAGQTTPTPCLPNPGYRPPREVVAPARRQVATPADDIDVWLARASGRPQEDDPGWYFSGRRRLNRELTDFLGRPGGVLLLTGTAGSGKSAVLGRAVTLSDPHFRAHPRYRDAVGSAPPGTVPAAEAVSVAVLARQHSAPGVLRELLVGLGIEPSPPGPTDDPVERWTALLDAHLSEPGDPVTVVLDGLDEAVEPFRIVHGVLAPLKAHCAPPPAAPLPGPRRAGPDRRRLSLVIGVRSSRPPAGEDPATAKPEGEGPEGGGPECHGPEGDGPEGDGSVGGAGPGAERDAGAVPEGGRAGSRDPGLLSALREVFPSATVLRTDGPGSRDDIADYVEALIGPDPTDRAGVREAAETVADEVWPSFLDARLAGEQLRAAADPAELVASPQWRDLLHAGTTGLLRRDLLLAGEEGLPPDVALALLRSGAFALGAGIPWSNVWPTVAGALLGRPIDDPDRMIGTLLSGGLAGYLAHDHEDDRLVYRPAHERLAEILRDPRQDLLPDPSEEPVPPYAPTARYGTEPPAGAAQPPAAQPPGPRPPADPGLPDPGLPGPAGSPEVRDE